MESGELKINLGESAGDVREASAGVVPTTPQMSMLASYIRRVFVENATHREMSGIDQKLLDSMRASKGEYSPEELARFRAAGLPDNIYTPLTITKQRAALSQLSEIFTSPGDKPWVISPSPTPEVPESVAKDEFTRIVATFMQVVSATGQVPTPEQMFRYAESRMDEVHRKCIEWARVRAERMERKVHDQMVEGGWIDAFNTFCKYLVDYGTAVIRGPVPRVMLRKRVKETRLGTWKYELEPRETLCYDAINPWDLYPSKGAKDVSEGHLCIRTRFTTAALWRYATGKAKGAKDEGEWNVDTIRALLARFPEGGVRIDAQPFDLARQLLENDGPSDSNRCMMEGVEFFGDVRGSMLTQLGITRKQNGDPIEEDEFYEVDAIEMGGYVIYCKVIDPCIGRPLSKGVFYENAGSWWGGNISERLDAAQRTVNAALRNLINNMAMASGPMLYIKDVSRVAEKTPDALKVKPWKVLKFNMGGYGQTDVPVGVIEFSSHVNELLKIFEWASTQADEDSGIPAYTYGQAGGGGALRTSSGLAMLTEAANRVMKMVVTGVDSHVVRDVVRRTVDYNMVYDDDLGIKGDCEVNPAGTMGMILREAESNRRKQLLNIALTPPALQIFGPRIPVAIMREEIKTLGLPNVDDALPSKEKVEETEMLQKLEQYNRAMSAGPQEAQLQGGEAQEAVQQPVQPGMESAQQGAAQVADAPEETAMRGGVAERRSVA